jgi:hypothetical protein
LEEYAGDWVSEELDTHYVLTVVDGKLVAQHYRHGTIRLTAREPDVFVGDLFFLRAIGDMFIGEGRARNLRFVRAARRAHSRWS